MTKWYAFEWISDMIFGGEKELKMEVKKMDVLDKYEATTEEKLFDNTVTEAIACGFLENNKRRDLMEREQAIQRKVDECIHARKNLVNNR